MILLFTDTQRFFKAVGWLIIDFINFFKIDFSDILIICDDLDTAIGTYRLRYKGSSGGHNGLKNIERHLNTQEYKRIKIGISNNKLMDTKDYVLGKFRNEELELLSPIVDKMPAILDDYISIPFDHLMNKYNLKG